MQTDLTSSTERRILRQPAVLELTGVHATTLYRWERQGRFPKRIRLGPNANGWFADEVIAWQNARQRVSESPAPARPAPNPASRGKARTRKGGR